MRKNNTKTVQMLREYLRIRWESRIKQKLIRTKKLDPRFNCKCEREKVVNSIKQFYSKEDYVTIPDQPSIEVSCEFCGRVFLIKFEELKP